MSLNSQWRLIRHYLSATNLQTEIDKLLQRIKPASPEQWESLIQNLQKAISVRLTQATKEIEINKSNVKSTSLEEAESIPTKVQEKKDEKQPEKVADSLGVGADDSQITIEGLLRGLKLKKDLHFGKISEPTWKSNKPVVNKTSIQARTAYVVSAVRAAAGAGSAAHRVHDFVHHMHHYPEAKDYAIKEGAVRALLRVQDRFPAREAELHEATREALALVGWVAPPRGAGPRVLALDGGGIRGLVALELLQQLERAAQRPVSELFDLVVGVSTGAIIAAVIGSGAGSLETAAKMYKSLSKEMFGNTSLIGGTSRLVWTHSYYDTQKWEKMLRDSFGDITLSQCNRKQNPKMALVSCVVNSGRLSPFVFRSYEMPWRVRGARGGAGGAAVWVGVRASAAAPTYFGEVAWRGLLLQDGGMVANNPAGLALQEARALWGRRAAAAATLVSLGTGRAPAPPAPPRAAAPRPSSWRDKFLKILDSATDTEGVHQLVNELVPAERYFRLNPPLLRPCAMDEVDDAALHHMLHDTANYIRRNEHKLQRAAAALCRPRPLLQRVGDRAARWAVVGGLAHHRLH